MKYNADGSTTVHRSGEGSASVPQNSAKWKHSGSGNYTGDGTGTYQGSTDVTSSKGNVSTQTSAGNGQATTSVTTDNGTKTYTAGDGQVQNAPANSAQQATARSSAPNQSSSSPAAPRSATPVPPPAEPSSTASQRGTAPSNPSRSATPRPSGGTSQDGRYTGAWRSTSSARSSGLGARASRDYAQWATKRNAAKRSNSPNGLPALQRTLTDAARRAGQGAARSLNPASQALSKTPQWSSRYGQNRLNKATPAARQYRQLQSKYEGFSRNQMKIGNQTMKKSWGSLNKKMNKSHPNYANRAKPSYSSRSRSNASHSTPGRSSRNRSGRSRSGGRRR
jgi:hypothetical protein